MTDFDRFALALYKYQKDAVNIGDNERNVRYLYKAKANLSKSVIRVKFNHSQR